jgi:hypothetical protein
MNTNILTFDNLCFITHPLTHEGKMAKIRAANGYEFSVIGGPGFYGDGETSFELAIYDKAGQMVGNDVSGWLSPEEITAKMAAIQQL